MGVDWRNHIFAPGFSPGWRLPVIKCPLYVAGLPAARKMLLSLYFPGALFVIMLF
jgi:hypothetical protein